MLDHKITAQLKADKFSAFGVEAENVETSFTIADGALAVDKLVAKNLAGAEITATGRAEGSLLDYKGSGEITLKSADPGPFFTMLKEHLPQHPVMDRLVRNAAWYTNTALRGALTLGGDEGDGLALTLAGVSNGSRVNLDYRMSDLLALTGKGTTNLEATLENRTTSILFGQAGLDPLPVEADANGRLALKVQASGTDPADASLTFATDRTPLLRRQGRCPSREFHERPDRRLARERRSRSVSRDERHCAAADGNRAAFRAANNGNHRWRQGRLLRPQGSCRGKSVFGCADGQSQDRQDDSERRTCA
ncbi:hypothetical protein AJ87_29115 [Rhizobium yanglingense]|nr:hypothetical protein AJ87_29115 [Rhizobium yanglingense]